MTLFHRVMLITLGAMVLGAPAIIAQTATGPAPEKSQTVIKGGGEELLKANADVGSEKLNENTKWL